MLVITLNINGLNTWLRDQNWQTGLKNLSHIFPVCNLHIKYMDTDRVEVKGG